MAGAKRFYIHENHIVLRYLIPYLTIGGDGGRVGEWVGRGLGGGGEGDAAFDVQTALRLASRVWICFVRNRKNVFSPNITDARYSDCVHYY